MSYKASRRRLLTVGAAAAAAALPACLTQTAPTTTTAAPAVQQPAPAVPAAQVQQQPSVTLKMQSTWAVRDLFHEIFVDWAKKVEEMSGGRLKIDILPTGAVAGAFQVIDAVHSGTLDGGHGVPVYWFNKDRATSLFGGSGPAYGLDANSLLGWIYYGGGQELYNDILQRKLKLNVISFFHGPMPTEPLGWYKDEIKSPDDFKGMKFRTVGMGQDMFQSMGAAVVALPGPDIVPALERGVIDAAEFNNTTSDTVYGFPDVRKVYMTKSYHQPAEFLELLINKSKYDSLPKDLQAIIKWGVVAQSADMAWKFMDRNSKDFFALKAKGIRMINTPQSVLRSQLQIWQTIVDKDRKENPEFAKADDSMREWAKRVLPWQLQFQIQHPDEFAYNFYVKS